ncbi:MAG: mechanosensitive ion channel domain-containing protein [Pseudomonadota bacterium]
MHTTIYAVLVAVALLWPLGALAQDEVAPPEAVDVETDTGGIFVAPVMVDGESLFVVRGSSALPATERAATIARRLAEVAGRSDSAGVTVEIRDTEFGPGIFGNGLLLTVVTQADAELEQIPVDVLAGIQAEVIRRAILQYRSERTDTARIDSAIEAVGWTAGFLVLCMLILWYRRRLPEKAARFAERRAAGVEEATKQVVQSRAIAEMVRYVVRIVLLVILFVAFYYYASFVLFSFAETRPIALLLFTYVTEPFVIVLGGFVDVLPDLIVIAVIVWVTRYLIKGVRIFFDNVEAGVIQLESFEPHWIWPTYTIARTVLILIAAVVAFPYIPGSQSAAFQGLTILLGVMVSLGSNSVVSNMLAGIFVLYRRSMNVGDRISVGGHKGDVVQIKLMETYVKSIKNELVSIPNSTLLNSEVKNFTKRIDGRGILVHTTVGIGYEEPRKKITAMLIEAANRTIGLKREPNPFVLVTGLADYSVNYQINAFTTRGSRLPLIESELHKNILDVFQENAVQIMTPSYMADPEVPKIPEDGWNGQLESPGKGEDD